MYECTRQQSLGTLGHIEYCRCSKYWVVIIHTYIYVASSSQPSTQEIYAYNINIYKCVRSTLIKTIGYRYTFCFFSSSSLKYTTHSHIIILSIYVYLYGTLHTSFYLIVARIHMENYIYVVRPYIYVSLLLQRTMVTKHYGNCLFNIHIYFFCSTRICTLFSSRLYF